MDPCAPQCVGVSVGMYSRHSLRHTDQIEICTQRTVDSQEVNLRFFDSEFFGDLFAQEDWLNSCTNEIT